MARVNTLMLVEIFNNYAFGIVMLQVLEIWGEERGIVAQYQCRINQTDTFTGQVLYRKKVKLGLTN